MNKKLTIRYLVFLVQVSTLVFFGVAFAQDPTDIPPWLRELSSDDSRTVRDRLLLAPLLETIRDGNDSDVETLVSEIGAQTDVFRKVWKIITRYDRDDLFQISTEGSEKLNDNGEGVYLDMVFSLAELDRETKFEVDSGNRIDLSPNQRLLNDLNRFDLRSFVRRLEAAFDWRLSGHTPINWETVPHSDVFPTLLFPLPDDQIILEVTKNEAAQNLDEEFWERFVIAGKVLISDDMRILRRGLIDDISRYVERLITLTQALISRISAQKEIRFDPANEKRIRENLGWLYDIKVELIDRAMGKDTEMFRLAYAKISSATLARGFYAYRMAVDNGEKNRWVKEDLMLTIEHVCWLLRSVYSASEERVFLLTFFNVDENEASKIKTLANVFFAVVDELVKDLAPEDSSLLDSVASFRQHLIDTDRFVSMNGILPFDWNQLILGVSNAEVGPGVYSQAVTWPVISTQKGGTLLVRVLGIDPTLQKNIHKLNSASTRILMRPIK